MTGTNHRNGKATTIDIKNDVNDTRVFIKAIRPGDTSLCTIKRFKKFRFLELYRENGGPKFYLKSELKEAFISQDAARNHHDDRLAKIDKKLVGRIDDSMAVLLWHARHDELEMQRLETLFGWRTEDLEAKFDWAALVASFNPVAA